MYNNREYKQTYLTGGTTAQVFTGRGTLHAIVVGTTAATAVDVFDMVNPGTVTNTATVMVLKASVAENTYLIDAVMANGCYVTYGSGGTYTVLWTQG